MNEKCEILMRDRPLKKAVCGLENCDSFKLAFRKDEIEQPNISRWSWASHVLHLLLIEKTNNES